MRSAGRANHQNILGRYFTAQRFVYQHAAPAVSEGDRDCALGLVLANDVFVQFLDDFSGCHL
jgi:hypothetical protein